MMDVATDTSSAALADAIDANLIEKSLSFARFFGGEIHGPNPLWFVTGRRMPNNNGVVSAVFQADEVRSGIKTVFRPFREQGTPLTWWVGPRSSPDNLGKYLQHYGMTHNRDMIGMAAPLEILPAPESPVFSLELVEDMPTLKAWYDLVVQCFPMTYSQSYLESLGAISLRPGAEWLHYVGRVNGEVLTASSLFLGGGAAGLYNLGTLPQARSQGYGALTTLQTFARAREIGYQIGTLQTTYPNALRMYHRMGFEVYCKIGIYVYSP